jgi:hypothetical protein
MRLKIFFLAAISILFTFFSFAQDSGMQRRTLKVNKGGNLYVSLSVGDVDITTSEKDEIIIKYDKDEGSDFEISQSGNNVTISSSSDSWGNDLMITVPSLFNIKVNTMGGDIKVTGSLKGEVDFSTSGGDIDLDKVIGNVKLKSSGGDISTGDINGDADISTSGGDIALGKISGKAEVMTAGGNIAMRSVGKSAEIKTAGGNVAVNDIGGDSEIKTGGGNIAANKINGQAIIKTGGGNISLESATGYIDAETGAGNISIQEALNRFKATTGAGDIYVHIAPNIKGDCELKSGTGSITLYVPANAKVTINAVVKSIGWGNDESSIDSDFPGSSTGIKRHVNQQAFNINGGGAEINIYAALGSIRIKKIK